MATGIFETAWILKPSKAGVWIRNSSLKAFDNVEYLDVIGTGDRLVYAENAQAFWPTHVL